MGREHKWNFGVYGEEPPLIQRRYYQKWFLGNEAKGSKWYKSWKDKSYGEGLTTTKYCAVVYDLSSVFNYCGAHYGIESLHDYFNRKRLT
jgi:hypothetical protein